jgi:predicted RNA binding protein YcfA (HicA-like mRNA interferase family)
MGRLRILSGKGVYQILEKYGFRKFRQHEGPVVMQCQTETDIITVPVPDHSELKIGTLSSIMRQSRLPREVFEI